MANSSDRERNYSRALKVSLLEKGSYRCQYCGKGIDVRACTIDHLDPVGPDEVGNYLIACNPCNTAKGSKTLDDYRAYIRVRNLRQVLPELNWTTAQLVWLSKQAWFPCELPPHNFFFEESL
jgi:5-methylcytosine-specific restriction endonuclease McrA